MRKRIGSRIALISALTMLAVEALSPVAAIAAEDGAVESEYVEAVSMEDAAVEAEVEDAQNADAQDVEISGVEEAVDDEEAVEISGVEDEAPQEDVEGEPAKTYEGSIDLNGDIYVGDTAGDVPGVLTMETKLLKKESNEMNVSVINILADGDFFIYSTAGDPVMDRYIKVADNVNATLSFGGFNGALFIDHEKLDWYADRAVPFIEAGAGSKITILANLDPNSDGGSVEVNGGSFISQKGNNSVINVDLAKNKEKGYLDVSHTMGASNLHDLIVTEGTMNMDSGSLSMSYASSAVALPGGTLNVNGGELNLNNNYGDTISGEGGSVNVKDGKLTITEAEADGIDVENVDISGGEVMITGFSFGEYDKNFYDPDNNTANTLSEKDGVETERINLKMGSHKGIKVGNKAKTIEFKDGKADKITVPASGSFKMSGGKLEIDNASYVGHKFSVLAKETVVKPTEAGLYIIGAPDDTIYSGKDIEISGGDLKLSSSDCGMTAGEKVMITGEANINITGCYEGIEGSTIVIGESGADKGPKVVIGKIEEGFEAATYKEPEGCIKEGICASSETEEYTYDTYDGYLADDEVNYTRKSTAITTGNLLKTYAGSVDIYIDSECAKKDPQTDDVKSNPLVCRAGRDFIYYYPSGDGIHCDGTYDDRGGFVRVYGDTDGDGIPFATNNDFIFTVGPSILGTGSDFEGKSIPTAGAGVYIVWGGKGQNKLDPMQPDFGVGADDFSFDVGDTFKVVDSKGELVYEDILPFRGTFIIFGSPLLKNGEKYKVSVGDKEKELGGLRKDEADPEEVPIDPVDPEEEKKDSTISVNIVLGYTVSYNSSISYNGAKIYLKDVTFGGAKLGGTLSNNTIIFKKIKYKNNKFVGQAQMRLQFKAAKTKKDGSKFSREEKAKIKAEVKKLNNYFKKNYLTFEIVPRQLLANEIVEVKGTYKAKKSKFSIKLRVDTKATNAKGKALKPIKVKEVKKSGKGDFEIDPKSFNEKNGTVVLKGKNNFTGTCTVKGIVAK